MIKVIYFNFVFVMKKHVSKKKKRMTQKDLIAGFFRKRPNKNISHPEVVDWARDAWKKQTGNVLRDPDRAIRILYEEGYLIKVKKGVYRHNPKSTLKKQQQNFSTAQKEKILQRDGYKCVICGAGEKEGAELHVDHIKPKHLGGRATINNGQVLCSQHNFLKKNLKYTETGKKMFIRLHALAKKEKNNNLQQFCVDVLKTYEKHNMNGHIEWKE